MTASFYSTMYNEHQTWADLDEANKADGHYNRYPEFYRAAREAEEQAALDHDHAIDEWINCPQWQTARVRELRRSVVATEERWLDCRSAKSTLYHHWMNLIRDEAQECECTPDAVTVCRACRAHARLNNPAYEPNIKDLLLEE